MRILGKKDRKEEIVQAESVQSAAPDQKRRKWQNIWWLGAVLSLAGAFIMLLRYLDLPPIAREDPSMTDIGSIGLCARYNYVLYRDLYSAVNGKSLTFEKLYGQTDEREQELTLSDSMISRGKYFLEGEGAEDAEDAENAEYTESTENKGKTENVRNADTEEIQQFWERVMQQAVANMQAVMWKGLDDLSESMSQNMDVFDYWIQDHETGTIVTNTLQTEKGQNFSVEEYGVWFRMEYDAAGNPSVKGGADKDVNRLAKVLYEHARRGLYDVYIGESSIYEYVPESVELSTGGISGYVPDAVEGDSLFLSQLEQRARSHGGPRDCTVYYGIKRSQWETIVDNYHGETDFTHIYHEYRAEGLGGVFLVIGIMLWGGGFFYGNPRREDKKLLRHFYRAPAEAVIVGSFLFPIALHEEIVVWAARLYMTHNPGSYLHTAGSWTWADALVYGQNLVLIAGLFFAAWYMGCCLGETRRLGIRGYLHRRMVCSRILGWCKERIRRYYQTLVSLDITKDSRRQVIKLLIINAVVVLLLCTMWMVGWFGVIIYSLLLYFVIKKYISDLQKKYSILLRATNEIADGNLEVKITEHLGVFEPFKPQIYRIEEGFQKAVAEEVKSQRMKTELITNVSHDLKTPLTAIITYVNLLKEDNVTEEQRAQYLQILEQKSLRLKALIEDLFEVSKANSKNVTLNLVDVDIVNLLRQVEFEQEDRLEERNLAVRLRLPEEKVMVRLDSQKAYRIYENLFGNIIKYAMEGTRIYVDLEQNEKEVTVRLKNITEQEITVSGEELTERFVRGDTSRNTEGSGLGLAIVRSFTELMGGRFEVTVDGDLFTASTTWMLEQDQLSL